MRDMTSGNPYGHLWRYALPLLLGNWLQLAYNAVDSIIAGRFIGQNALAAEGIAYSCMIGWSLMLLFEVPYYFVTCRREGLPAGGKPVNEQEV